MRLTRTQLPAIPAEAEPAIYRARQARHAQRAAAAQRLGQLEIGRVLREPQRRILAAGQRIAQVSRSPGQHGQRRTRHVTSPRETDLRIPRKTRTY